MAHPLHEDHENGLIDGVPYGGEVGATAPRTVVLFAVGFVLGAVVIGSMGIAIAPVDPPAVRPVELRSPDQRDATGDDRGRRHDGAERRRAPDRRERGRRRAPASPAPPQARGQTPLQPTPPAAAPRPRTTAPRPTPAPRTRSQPQPQPAPSAPATPQPAPPSPPAPPADDDGDGADPDDEAAGDTGEPHDGED